MPRKKGGRGAKIRVDVQQLLSPFLQQTGKMPLLLFKEVRKGYAVKVSLRNS